MKVREIKANFPQEKMDPSSSKKLTPEQENRRRQARMITITIATVLACVQLYFLFPQEGFGSLLIIGVPTCLFSAVFYLALLEFFGVPLPESEPLPSSFFESEFPEEDPYFDPGDPISTLNPANPLNPINYDSPSFEYTSQSGCQHH